MGRLAPIGLALGVATASAALSGLAGRTPSLDEGALSAALSARIGRTVDAVRVVPGGDAPWGLGEPVRIWFTTADDAERDLHLQAGRRQGRAVALIGPAHRVSTTPLTRERLLDARPDAALVALEVNAAQPVAIVHHADGRQLEVHFTTPPPRLDGRLSATEAIFEGPAGRIVVDLARGTVDPPEAGSAHRTPGRPSPATMVGVRPAPEAVGPPQQVPGWPAWRPAALGHRVEAPGGVQLWALDSREVELRYVPGRVSPGGQHGRPGDGLPDRAPLGWIAATGDGGAALDGVALEPFQRGGAAIELVDGQARIGPFAGEPAAPGQGALRRAGPPLVLDGQPVVTEADRPARRGGLGITADGWLVAGWSADATRLALAEALARVGVQQAIDAGADGFAAGDAALDPAMATDWGTPHRAERYAIVPRTGLDGAEWQAAGWHALPGGRLATRRVDAVGLTLIDPAGLRATLVPGLAEIGGGVAAPSGGWLLGGGVLSSRAPYGLKLGGEVRRALREGAMGLTIDPAGRLSVQRASAAAGEETVLQGPGLIADGRKAIQPARVDPGPLAALGQRADGLLVYAVSSAGPEALADALLSVEVIAAIRLGDHGTSDTGGVLPDGRDGFGSPAATPPLAGTALHLAPAPRSPSVEAARAVRPR